MSITLNLQDPTGFRARDFTSTAGGGSFVTVQVTAQGGTVDIFLSTAAECDELIRAAVEAKRLLSPPEPSPKAPDPDPCKCGHPGYEHIYTGTSPCTVCGCKGFYSAATAILAKAIETGEPVIVEDDNEPHQAQAPESWCAATQGDGDFVIICNSQPGHDGPVHVAWSADGGVVACWHVTVTAPAVAS